MLLYAPGNQSWFKKHICTHTKNNKLQIFGFESWLAQVFCEMEAISPRHRTLQKVALWFSALFALAVSTLSRIRVLRVTSVENVYDFSLNINISKR